MKGRRFVGIALASASILVLALTLWELGVCPGLSRGTDCRQRDSRKPSAGIASGSGHAECPRGTAGVGRWEHPKRSEYRSADPRRGPRGLCPTGRLQRGPRHGGCPKAARSGRRNAPRAKAGGRSCDVDSRILELGIGSKQIHLDQRHLAVCAGRRRMGVRILDSGRHRLSVRFGILRKNDVAEVTYLPQKPPDTLENGAVGTAPSANVVWVPGCWIWRGTHYAWRPGFWGPCNPDWLWIPALRVDSIGICIRRWTLGLRDATSRRHLAPVVFRPGIVFVAGYVYTPAVAMDFDACQGCLFCRPGCYCFGDYYGPAYVGIGIYPWFDGITATATTRASRIAAGTMVRPGVNAALSITASASHMWRLVRRIRLL